ncbi:ABC transporter permease [Nocardia altamirensis]|uniref:ABC transporter permease n=1 Tax=Nocardia altamirensis TaxID=472158 RepID=UPI000ABF4476|nr:ABC transporter permease [Nocardia altamirensis]
MTMLDESAATPNYAELPPERRMVGSVRAVAVIAGRDLQRQVRRPGLLISNAVQLLFFIAIYAVGFDAMVGAVGSVSFSAYILPGIIAIQVATIGISAGLAYAWDREFGVLREMTVAPVPRMCLPAGKVVSTGIIIGVQSLVLLLCAPVFGLSPTLAQTALAACVYLGGSAVFSLLGLFLATMLNQIQTLQACVQLTMMPMLFLSGSVFRPDGVPAWLSALIHLNPLTYLVDLGRQVLVGSGQGMLPIGVDLGVLVGLALVFALGIRLAIGR